MAKLAGMVLCLWLAAGRSAEAASDAVFAKWLSDAHGFEQAMERRRGTSDALLLYFYTDWCPYCRQLNSEIMASSPMRRYVDRVLAVRINPEHGAKEAAIASAHGVTGYPTVFVLAPGADQPKRISTSSLTPEQFVQACEEAGRAPKRARATTAAPKSSRKTAAAKPKPPASRAAFVPRHPVTLYLKNGERLEGDLVRETPAAVTIGLEYGEVIFERAEIDHMVTPAP